jgi:3-hydroxyisobutyrate dehydrogenase-like beta-hydroxyacid dehydrogenase
MQIGVIGLGAMGRAIALKLLEAGHELTVWNRTKGPVTELVGQGAKAAATVADAMQGDFVLTILFDDQAVRENLLGAEGLARARSDCVHVCMTTLSIPFASELEAFYSAHVLRYVGAPMLGRPDIIAKQGLNILVGGDPKVLDALTLVFGALGKVWVLGDRPHQAQVAKLAANFMISGALEAMAEAAAVLKAHNTDTDRFFDVMGETLFGAFVYKSYGPMISGHPPLVPSGLSMPLKDNGHFINAARHAGLKVPLAETVRFNLTRAAEGGAAAADWSTALAMVARGQI